MKKSVKISCLSEAKEMLPEYATNEAAGADVRAFIKDSIVLFPNQRILIPTGLRLHIPEGFEVQIRPRSGLAYKHGVTVLNSPGTIDSDYRGEIKVLLINLGENAFTLEPGMRVAQMVVAPVVRAEFFLVEELETSIRDSGGFGHTGVM